MVQAAPPPLIRLRGVHKSYRSGDRCQRIFAGLDLDVHEGELVVLLGRSGSGKSTLLNLLGGLDLPDSGLVEVAGQRVSELTEPAISLFRRHTVGMVFQAYNLIPTLTVAENVALPLALTCGRQQLGEQELGLLGQLGLSDKAHAYPEQLSGGEQQRVALARALVHAPRLVLADEPTGNLDLATGRRVLDLLDSLVREQGRTLVMATHSAEVMGLADRVLRIEQGGLRPCGP